MADLGIHIVSPSRRMKLTTVYILRLEGQKFYIGQSQNLEKRLAQHWNGTGAAWTRLHRPVAIEGVYQHVSPFLEDALTKELFWLKGRDAVRGGSYARPLLPDIEWQQIQREIWGATSCCFLCGSPSHFASQHKQDTSELK